MKYDAVLLIAFGGPKKFEDVRPFMSNVLRGRRVSPERVETVVEQYREIGGISPINEITFRQAKSLKVLLASPTKFFKVYVGMRNWEPYIKDTLMQMKEDGVKRAACVILAPHQCEASWGRYQEAVFEAQQNIGGGAPQIDYLPNWHYHPLFIEAIASCVKDALQSSSNPEDSLNGFWIFTAHSIPLLMNNASNYSGQVLETAGLVAKKFGKKDWCVAYQSRSGLPDDLWLEPDVGDKIQKLASQGIKKVVVIPLSFVCDHIEVLYDLDIKAKKVAEQCGVEFVRAKTVNDHPKFVEMLSQIILNHFQYNQ